jgi:hypothetical protein
LKASSLAGARLGATAEEWAELREKLLKKDRRMRKDIELREAEGEPGRELMELMKSSSADVQASPGGQSGAVAGVIGVYSGGLVHREDGFDCSGGVQFDLKLKMWRIFWKLFAPGGGGS